MPGRAPTAASRSACARRSAASTPMRTPRPTSTRGSTSSTSRCRAWSTSARRSRARPARRPSCSTTTARPPARSRRRRRSRMRCRCSTARSGDRYLFSGRTTDTPATVSADVMLDGVGTQAGLKQLINERRQADQGVGNMGHLTRFVAAADDHRDQSRRGRLVVRIEARRGHLVADRRDRDAAGRRAAGRRPSISAPSIRTMAKRSRSTSICPTAPPSRSR